MSAKPNNTRWHLHRGRNRELWFNAADAANAANVGIARRDGYRTGRETGLLTHLPFAAQQAPIKFDEGVPAHAT
ncbi:MAG: hypothetical protein KTR17_06185 [Cellvibrionaceae bacterium]|nr:hypothetical protein [Cellvibrionaceae bacterium]